MKMNDVLVFALFLCFLGFLLSIFFFKKSKR
jgi:hypothetical protein